MFCIAMAQRFVLWIIIMELHHRKGLFGFFSKCILDFPVHSWFSIWSVVFRPLLSPIMNTNVIVIWGF